MAFSVEAMVVGTTSTRDAHCRGRTTIFGMGLFQPPPLDSEAQLTEQKHWHYFAASIDEDGTILDRGSLGSLGSGRHCEIAKQRHDHEKGTAGFSHGACSNYKWVWFQVNFEGTLFAGRKPQNLSALKIKR